MPYICEVVDPSGPSYESTRAAASIHPVNLAPFRCLSVQDFEKEFSHALSQIPACFWNVLGA